MSAGARAEDQLLEVMGLARRRALGCYLTPAPLAAVMAERLRPLLTDWSERRAPVVLDPAAGTGRLLAAVAALGTTPEPRLLGVERDAEVAAVAESQVPAASVRVGDGLELLLDERRRAWLGGAEGGGATADAGVDAVVANPPYLGEKGNAALFRSLRERVPAWAEHMAPRQDLQQLFLRLALALLRPGGELVFLMNGYWLTTDSGAAVREALAREAELLEVVDFGSARLFDDAPGQHGLLLHARRRAVGAGAMGAGAVGAGPTRFVRFVAPPAELGALCADLEGDAASAERVVGRLAVSGAARRWYFPSRDDEWLGRLEATGVPLGEVFETHQGVVSGADQVTARNREHIDGEARLGQGIFVLSDEERAALGLSAAEEAHLRRVVRGRQVAPFEVAPAQAWIIYASDGLPLDELPGLRRHLERFAPLLRRRRECRLGLMPWYRLHWPRAAGLFERPRLITPRRAPTPRFAMAPPGHCEQSDLALVTEPDDDVVRLGALLVVLNSEVMARWCQARGKQKGTMREFFGRALEELPLPAAVRDAPQRFEALAAYADGGRRAQAEDRVRALYERGWGG